MLVTIEGIYRSGKIELREIPQEMLEGARVVVTFLPINGIELLARGIDVAKAGECRASLMPFAEDWDSPEMSLYDDYDAALRHTLNI